MSWKPQGYPSMSPYLIAADGHALIRFIETVFHGEQLRCINRPDGSLMHGEVRIDDGLVMIGGVANHDASHGAHIHVYVPDAHATFQRAMEAGATTIQELQRKDDGDLRGGVQDVSGTTWWIASQ